MFWFEEPGQNSRQDTPRDETIVPGNHNDIEKRLWGAADELRVNSKLKASEYSLPVLGLIFLKYADFRFRHEEQELERKGREHIRQKLLYDLFEIYGFNPRPSFRNTGEQIDGSIEFEHQFYLIEARWQTNPIIEKDLLALHGRASGHSRIGRGIFITCGNFSPDSVYAFQRLQPTSIIGIDGQDLYLIFEKHLSLADVILHIHFGRGLRSRQAEGPEVCREWNAR